MGECGHWVTKLSPVSSRTTIGFHHNNDTLKHSLTTNTAKRHGDRVTTTTALPTATPPPSPMHDHKHQSNDGFAAHTILGEEGGK
jgi:hypothetical protein